MKLWVNVARQMWRHLNVTTFVEIDVSGRGNASTSCMALMPAVWANASRSTLVGSSPGQQQP